MINMSKLRTEWRLSEWNCKYSTDKTAPPMSMAEIQSAIEWLRDNYYPKPADCPCSDCPKYRPYCKLGVCRIAIGMCGDF